MINEIENLVEKYQAWLKDRTFLREVAGHIEITTPFLDRHNDFIQIYARRDDGGFVITDDGATIEDLILSGCNLTPPKRQHWLSVTLAGFGVMRESDNSLTVRATSDTFPQKKHNLIQAILAVNDLFFMAQPHVAGLFLEDVTIWMDLSDIRYTPSVKISGRSGYDHLFDFAIPKSKKAPERLVRALSNPTRDSAQSIAFAWLDTREARPAESEAYAILNDRDRRIPGGVEDALKRYNIEPVVWSDREAARDRLAA